MNRFSTYSLILIFFTLFTTPLSVVGDTSENKSNDQYCVIVDGYKWSKYFSTLSKEFGYRCIYVQSTDKQLEKFVKSSTYEPKDFEAFYVYDGNLPNLLEKLNHHKNIKAVIVGLESGVKLADLLSEQLQLPTNGTRRSLARTDKFQMAETLKAAGLRTPKYFKSDNYNKIVTWIKNNTIYPVVLKPLSSAGTDGVFICNSDEEVKNAYSSIMDASKNLFDKKNTEVMVQSYLFGTEYIVNTVSCNGIHYVSDIWKYQKHLINGKPIYDRETLLPSKGDVQSILIPYIFNVLTALEIKYGAAHNEVMLTQDGPILVETGARVGGNVVPNLHSASFQRNQAELSIYSYLQPTLFKQYTKDSYQIAKNMVHVLISSENNGQIKDISLDKKVIDLPSFQHIALIVKKGDSLSTTYDLLSRLGDLWLAHEDSNVVENDYQVFMQNILPNGILLDKQDKTFVQK